MRQARIIGLSFAVVLVLVLSVWLTAPKDEPTEATPSVSYSAPEVAPEERNPAESLDLQLDPQPADLIDLMTSGLPVEGCEDFVGTQMVSGRDEAHRREIREAVRLLSVSGDPEYLIGATFLDFEHDNESINPMLEQALRQLPEHPVALWHKLQHCQGTGCERISTARDLTRADPTNGLLWVEIAAEHIREGRYDDAESALRRAIASPRFDAYFVEYVTLVERALAATTELDYGQRVVYGIGIAAAVAIPGFSDIYNECRSDANDPAVWAPLCAELGKSLSSRSRNLLSSMIGHGLRRAAATRLGDIEEAAALKQEADQMREHYVDRQTRTGAHALLINDHAVLQRYLETFAAHGEMRAVDSLVEEAVRLRADESYDQCNFVIRQPDD